MSECINCGAPTSGARCLKCNGEAISVAVAEARASQDAALLAEVGVGPHDYPLRLRGVSAARMATRLNVSRERVYQLIRNAQRRQRRLGA